MATVKSLIPGGPARRGLTVALLLTACALSALAGGDEPEVLFPVVPVRLITTLADFRQPTGAHSGMVQPVLTNSGSAVLDNTESFTIRREAVLPGVLLKSPEPVLVIGLSWLWREFAGKGVEIQLLLPNGEISYTPVGTDERIGLLAALPADRKSGNPPTGIAVKMADADKAPEIRWICIPGAETFRICQARAADHKRIRWNPVPDEALPPLLLPIFDSTGNFEGFCRPQPNPMASNGEWSLLDHARILESVRRILETRSNIQSGYLGVFVDDIFPREKVKGVLVKGTSPGSPAQLAGFSAGDIIQRINSARVASAREFIQTLQDIPPNTRVTIATLRGGKPLQVEAVLGTVPLPKTTAVPFQLSSDPLTAPSPPAITPAAAVRFSPQRAGKPSIGIFMRGRPGGLGSRGVEITHVLPGSPAEKSGILPGDIVLRIAEQNVESPESLTRILGTTMPGEPVTVVLSRNGTSYTLRVTPR